MQLIAYQGKDACIVEQIYELTVKINSYPIIDCANLVCPAQLAILLAIFCTKLFRYLKDTFGDKTVNTDLIKSKMDRAFFIMLEMLPALWMYVQLGCAYNL